MLLESTERGISLLIIYNQTTLIKKLVHSTADLRVKTPNHKIQNLQNIKTIQILFIPVIQWSVIPLCIQILYCTALIN